VEFFRSFGFAAFRAAVSDVVAPLFDEIGGELADAYGTTSDRPDSDDGVPGYFLPAMTPRTPTSLALIAALAPWAKALLRTDAVVPVYADTTVFFGATPWHSDIGMPIPFVKFGVYADDLDGTNGALRFVPGSHQEPLFSQVRAMVHRLETVEDRPPAEVAQVLPHVVVDSRRGDLIALDGKVWHATLGGSRRLQWSLPFVDASDPDLVRRFFDSFVIDAPTRGHDPARHPVYSDAFLQTELGRTLEALGVAEVAAARWVAS
jgi:hypothetical protein